MSDESIVYLVQDPPPFKSKGRVLTKDLSSAQRYGRIEPILDSQEQPSLTPSPSFVKMSKALRHFDVDKDYLCFAGGDVMSLALAMTALRDLNYDEVQVLRWERERDTSGNRTNGGFYVPVMTRLKL